MLIDFVCYQCPTVLASEREDGTWKVKIRAKVDGKWHTVTEWQPRFVCPDCRAEGFVDPFTTIPTKGHGRVRIPIRPFV